VGGVKGGGDPQRGMVSQWLCAGEVVRGGGGKGGRG